ncbi:MULTISPECIES: aromatic amino acid transport family protein [Bifidobacterium]|uniref:aromatic amino acid transport family protein n=1 Tax=Bifidobacterium TaxID=1678 RepID=UPI001C6A7D53|nr:MULTISPECIES: aromatic amino acid transport family protein [Bifidobacterium]MCX8686856.1 HAAAP family serine/threonine permease [Bifidobacterium sp. B4142]QYN60835.1 HAAAP family serine/threonine permease [Bifidobacterium asteroides]
MTNAENPTARVEAAKGTKEYAAKWHKGDTVWMLSLFGTAIGAGVLFLPIDAGSGGIIGLIFMLIIAFPTTFFAHRAMSRFVLSADKPGDDITDVVEEHYGYGFGLIFTIIYFLSIFPILLVYGISITNTAESFIVNQMHMSAPPRWLLSLVLVVVLMAIVRLGTAVTTKVMSILVYPFVAVLVLFSLYLIPHWNTAIFSSFPRNSAGGFSISGLLESLWLLIPVMVFAFNHSPIISSFSVAEREEYGDKYVDGKVTSILKRAELLMVSVVMFFVFSCVLSLSPADLAQAKAQNVSILTYIANHFNNPIINYVAPFIAFVAIAKSFLGHYLGTSEGLSGIIRKVAKKADRRVPEKTMQFMVEGFILLVAWLVAWANFSVMNMIETMIGPIIAFVLFLMPMYAIHTVPSLKKYSGKASNVFIVVIGLIAVSAIFYNIVHLFV